MEQTTLTEMYAFLLARYKTDRFEGRNGEWCPDYSKIVAQSSLDQLASTGIGYIGPHESATGQVIRFDDQLQIIA